jgi:hypothetical protein
LTVKELAAARVLAIEAERNAGTAAVAVGTRNKAAIRTRVLHNGRRKRRRDDGSETTAG